MSKSSKKKVIPFVPVIPEVIIPDPVEKNEEIAESTKKEVKVFSDMVIRETAFKNKMTYNQAKAHLEKYHS